MGEFLRKLAALAACVTLAELLLPRGELRQTARLALTLLVTLLMTGALTDLLAAANWAEPISAPALIDGALATYDAQADARYRQTALTAWANQLAARCERLCQSAGYKAAATAYLQEDGAVHHVALHLLSKEETPLYSPAELSARIAAALGLEEAQIVWQGAMP